METKRNERLVNLSFDGRTMQVEVGAFFALMRHARAHLTQTQHELEREPLEWDSATVESEFEERLADIRQMKNGIEHAECVRQWLDPNDA